MIQFNIILYDEATMLESFTQIFGMACTYFSKFSAIPKNN
jgi:hypothetical protein